MTSLGHILLLVAFVASGVAATASLGDEGNRRRLRRSHRNAGIACLVSLTLACLLLGRALLAKDFGFAYVVQYTDLALPWQYSLSALWVGQAGSLLLWCWLSAATALAFLRIARRTAPELRARAFGIQMALVCSLAAIMIFAADPMQASTATVSNGNGLDPLLQHPMMLIHPPVVFLGYSLWAVPFSLIIAALAGGKPDTNWIRAARPWGVLGWAMLGIGILLGANWAYEELGWGGYWAWDPVENGSLLPWLTATAFLHAMMAWQYRGILKKTCLTAGLATFALCLFSAFLTRSGLFSSLHAFSQSPIGWLFLALAFLVVAGGGVLMLPSRRSLRPDRKIEAIATRESLIVLALFALLMLTAVTLAGTLVAPLSGLVSANRVAVGPEFYNRVLAPVGLVLAIATPMAPLLRWGRPPEGGQTRILLGSLVIVLAGFVAALLFTNRPPLESAMLALAVWTVVAIPTHLGIEVARRPDRPWGRRFAEALAANRRPYAGFVIHSGFMMAAVGIAASSLGAIRHELEMAEGNRAEVAGYSIHYAGVEEIKSPRKLVVETLLHVTAGDGTRFTLRPAQHYHYRQQEWTTEVAIHSTWARDVYVIVHAGQAGCSATFSVLIHPMMKWLWGSGWLTAIGLCIGFWPFRSRAADPSPRAGKLIRRRKALAGSPKCVEA